MQAAARRRGGRTIELYVLALTAPPFIGTLLIVLPALLLERLLRLFALVADNSVPAGSVGRMLADLAPDYVGQTLPIALFIGIHAVVARLVASSELDAMLGAGLSLARISRPFVLAGLVAAALGFGIYGYAQPLTHYAYKVALQAATEGLWNASVPAGAITRITDDLVVTADTAGPGGGLGHVFIYQRHPDGSETVSTGRSGVLALAAGGTELVLLLDDGERLEVGPDGGITTLTAPSTEMRRPYVMRMGAFAPRGANVRDMTLSELWDAPDTAARARWRLQGELHSRLVRALSLTVLPLLAVAVGLAAKRTRRRHGIVIGVIAVILYLHAVQLTQALGTAGLADPRPLLWAVFAAFAGFCVFMFQRANRFPHEGPLDPVLDTADDAIAAGRAFWRRMARGWSGGI